MMRKGMELSASDNHVIPFNPHTPPEATLTVTLSPQKTETEANKREDRLNRKKKKLNSSEIMETLREEFSTAPEVCSCDVCTCPIMQTLDHSALGSASYHFRDFR